MTTKLDGKLARLWAEHRYRSGRGSRTEPLLVFLNATNPDLCRRIESALTYADAMANLGCPVTHAGRDAVRFAPMARVRQDNDGFYGETT